MDEITRRIMEEEFNKYFRDWCEEHATTYDEPEDMNDQIGDAFDAGFPTKEALFSYIRYMPRTDRENFIRLQLKFNPIPGITVQGGTLVEQETLGLPRRVTDIELMFAQHGYCAVNNDVDNPLLDHVLILPCNQKDPTKGFYAIAYCNNETHLLHRQTIASFTYSRLVEYAAVGIMEYVARNFGPEEGVTEPAELYSMLIDLVTGGRRV